MWSHFLWFVCLFLEGKKHLISTPGDWSDDKFLLHSGRYYLNVVDVVLRHKWFTTELLDVKGWQKVRIQKISFCLSSFCFLKISQSGEVAISFQNLQLSCLPIRFALGCFRLVA